MKSDKEILDEAVQEADLRTDHDIKQYEDETYYTQLIGTEDHDRFGGPPEIHWDEWEFNPNFHGVVPEAPNTSGVKRRGCDCPPTPWGLSREAAKDWMRENRPGVPEHALKDHYLYWMIQRPSPEAKWETFHGESHPRTGPTQAQIDVAMFSTSAATQRSMRECVERVLDKAGRGEDEAVVMREVRQGIAEAAVRAVYLDNDQQPEQTGGEDTTPSDMFFDGERWRNRVVTEYIHTVRPEDVFYYLQVDGNDDQNDKNAKRSLLAQMPDVD
jgi:hypothetical protein